MAFEYNFMDEDYQRLYASEIRVASSAVISPPGHLISCLGLFGLAAFTANAEKRDRHPQSRRGIRYPAGIPAIQGIPGAGSPRYRHRRPLAWLGMHEWLDQFAYRYAYPGIFGLTGLAAIVITLLTISYQSISAAMSIRPQPEIGITLCLQGQP